MKDSVAPKVVALVPAWNAATFITRTLDAWAAQEYPNLEILISDDASTDETGVLCDEYARRDRRFRVVHQTRNRGWVGNVNALLGEARGDYFVFAAHDDVPEPTFLRKCVDALEANRRAVIAFSDMAGTKPNGHTIEYPCRFLDGVSRFMRTARIARHRPPSWVAFRGVFRADIVPRLGGLRTHSAGDYGADWVWLLHMSLFGDFIRVPELLVTKHFRRNSASTHWRRTARTRITVGMSAIRIVRHADIPSLEKLVTIAIVGWFVGWQGVRGLVWTLSRLPLSLRRSRPVPLRQ